MDLGKIGIWAMLEAMTMSRPASIPASSPASQTLTSFRRFPFSTRATAGARRRN
jgi:hypothetical protein